MGKKIKAYLAFSDGLYKLLVLLAFPLLMIVSGIFLPYGEISLILRMVLVIGIEIFADHWVFGGIQTKDGSQLEYFKSSEKGMGVIRDALAVSMVRLLLWTFVITAGSVLAARWFTPEQEGISILEAAGMIFTVYAVVVSGQVIGRFFGTFWVSIIIAYGGAVVGVIGMALVLQAPAAGVIIGAMAGIIVSVVSVKLAVWRVKESYYDK